MDVTDYKILSQIQKKADIPLVDLANLIGLSKTACWNRLRRLEEDGVIIGKFVQLNRFSLNLPIVVFLAITVRRHSKEWVKQFQFLIDQYPEIIEAHRLTGEGADYQLKIFCSSIESYDKLQQALIERIEFNSMSTRISLAELKNINSLPIALEETAI